MGLSFHSLRSQHSALVFRGYSLSRSEGRVTVTFDILLEPSIEFRPTLSFDAAGIEDERLAPFLVHLGLVELISYWKSACPRRVILKGISLSEDQVAWWRDLFIHGLGEFFFQNDIDPSDPNLLTIESSGEPLPRLRRGEASHVSGELVLAAGGKDSSLSLELLKSIDPTVRRKIMILNPSRSALESVSLAGYEAPVVVRRTIDKNLIALNEQGYLNGHTPFSAYLAFLGIMVADIYGLGSVIVSNERSASEENAIFHGLAVNHQYSKGERFERRFREYATKELPGSASYFSLIRPLFDLQVSGLFARCAPKHLGSFRSCNVGQREDRWCGRCPKCAFVALTLAPFVSRAVHAEIFGEEIFSRTEILEALEELVGLRDHKPFECVGTLGESRDALVLTLSRYREASESVPKGLDEIARRLEENGVLPSIAQARGTLSAWTDHHLVPEKYATALRHMVQEDSW
jgi:hypothetical protein